MPTSTVMFPMSSIDIATCLPVVYCGYLYIYLYSLLLATTMATCSLLWLSVVYYGYLQSTMVTCDLLSLPMLLSVLVTHSCIPCRVYMTIQSAMPKQSSELPIAFYAHLVNFSNFRSILSNRTYITEFVVSSNVRCNKIKQR